MVHLVKKSLNFLMYSCNQYQEAWIVLWNKKNGLTGFCNRAVSEHTQHW